MDKVPTNVIFILISFSGKAQMLMKFYMFPNSSCVNCVRKDKF